MDSVTQFLSNVAAEAKVSSAKANILQRKFLAVGRHSGVIFTGGFLPCREIHESYFIGELQKVRRFTVCPGLKMVGEMDPTPRYDDRRSRLLAYMYLVNLERIINLSQRFRKQRFD